MTQPDSVLVTGGGGFIGTWVLRELISRGLRPVVFDVQRNSERWERVLGARAANIKFVSGSLLDRELLKKTARDEQVSRIIHLAALLTPQCQQDPFAGCEINVLGSVALFELARTLGGQCQGISYASSYAVYGPEADDDTPGIKASESGPPTFYGVYKLAVDHIAQQYWQHFDIPSVGIRPHVVYGPERTVGLTAGPSLACRAVAQGEPYTINYTGSVGYDYVEDVASAFVEAALNPPRGSLVVDLPSQVATTEEFVRTIDRVAPGASSLVSVSGLAIPANIPPQPNYISAVFPGWKVTNLEEGIRKTIEFYKE